MTTTTEISFDVDNVELRYGAKTVLRQVNLTAYSGEFVCIVGRSGCGKTSLLRLLSGLVAPTSGKVTMAQHHTPEGASDPDCAMVFQSDSLFPWMSIEGNASFGLRARGESKAASLAKAREWLRRVGLPAEVDAQKPRQLSGGMRQRVNLVRALALEPRVILMDEPFAALDYLTREEMQAELLRLSQAQTMTTIFVTHDVTEAVFLADRIVVMDPTIHGISEVFDAPWDRQRSLDLKLTSQFADLCRMVSLAVRGAT